MSFRFKDVSDRIPGEGALLRVLQGVDQAGFPGAGVVIDLSTAEEVVQPVIRCRSLHLEFGRKPIDDLVQVRGEVRDGDVQPADRSRFVDEGESGFLEDFLASHSGQLGSALHQTLERVLLP
ncbi:hypothetical protein D3C85_1311650 [compost metagenome]